MAMPALNQNRLSERLSQKLKWLIVLIDLIDLGLID